MENNIIRDRIGKLRQSMKDNGLTAWYITTADYHNSEYVNDFFKVREFFSGFTGSNGDLLVTEDFAGLWTDGRYFVQAGKELYGTGIELFKMGEEGVPYIEKFIEEKLKEGDTLGFDGRTVSASFGKKLKKAARKKGFSLKYKKDIAGGIFAAERPPFPVSRAEVLDISLTGESVSDKLFRLREKLKENDADALFLNKLDDIMYLFNIRGNDVEYNPVLISYAFISMDSSVIFLQKEAVTEELLEHLKESDTEIRDYSLTEKYIDNIDTGTRVMADPAQLNLYLYKRLKKRCASVVLMRNPTEDMKAVKNETEIENMRKIYMKDSLALTRFILRVSDMTGGSGEAGSAGETGFSGMSPDRGTEGAGEYSGSEELLGTEKPFTEMDASDLLLSYRREIPEFRDLSFSTISAYGENAAMMHYEPGRDHEVVIERRGTLLVDSGGQYNGGTTDVTRTIVCGELTEEERRDYTLTACSMLRLLNARFLSGCTGRNLDILARERMWNEGMDYKCGTGHGIGYILNVHEGPQNIRWKATSNEAELKPGMAVTDEPGVYKKGKHGIRIENVLLVKEDVKTDDGRFLSFENLTFAPIDDRGIDRELMTEREREMYLSYQNSVCEALKPFMNDEEYVKLRNYSGV